MRGAWREGRTLLRACPLGQSEQKCLPFTEQFKLNRNSQMPQKAQAASVCSPRYCRQNKREERQGGGMCFSNNIA